MHQIISCTNSQTLAPDEGAMSNDIIFATRECVLGEVLVARSAVGVCAILLGSEAEDLKNDLTTRFPGSKLIANEPQLRDDLSKVVRFLKTPSEGIDLALDMRGTPFQRRVWEALRSIPVGTTVTYAELARRIGGPRWARAVARALAANPIALAIPCHRVIRSNGDLSGYRWGVERKRMLLDREAAA
jgi:AraC family transcriptional regulator, regulatory protein of adaptative response / methylated-DNA-[protein]-cysteine methyltransferase